MQVRLRTSTIVAIRRFAAEHKLKEPKAILDAGCSGARCPPRRLAPSRAGACRTALALVLSPRMPRVPPRARPSARPPAVGICTRWLAGEYPSAQVTGMDLSPYMLAVAELRERQWEQRRAAEARGASPPPATADAAAVGADAIPGSSRRQRIT